MMLDSIPNEMREYAQWIVWRYEEVSGGKPTKVPYSVKTGRLASVTDPSTWATFDECRAGLHAGWYSGVGFVFTEADPYTGIDLDATVDPKSIERQRRIYSEFASYSELSPSGQGLHIIVKGKIPSGRRRSSIEVYSSARFFTMTGNVYNNVPIAERQELLTSLWQQMGGPAETNSHHGDSPETETDQQILDKASRAVNGDKFIALYEGRWQEYYPSQSEADFAFVDIIAFYTQNRAQIARLFRASALGQRDKAKRKDYVAWMTNKSFDRLLPPIDIDGLKIGAEIAIEKAAQDAASSNGRTAPFEGVNLGSNPRAAANPEPAPASDAAPFKGEPNPYTVPPGLLGELANFFYAASPRPVPEISLAAAIGLMAGVCGQAYNVSNTGLNLYVMMLAPTGRGKEAIASGIDKMMNAISNQVPAAKQFRGPAEIASGQALIKYMDKSPSFVSVIGEFGYRLQNMASKHASASDLALKRTLLDLFNKSGHTQIFHPMIYSDKDKNTIAIPSPALTLLGESTPATFYNVADEAMIEDGLLPRFITIEYLGDRPELNKNHASAYPSFQLVDQFAALVSGSLALMSGAQGRRFVEVKHDDEAQALLDEFDKYADKQMNTSGKEVVAHLWNRAHINLLRLSALVAVGVNPYSPVVSADHVIWARGIIVHAINRMLQRFEQGLIGSSSEESKQIIEVGRVFREYLTSDYPTVAKYGAPSNLHTDRIIPYVYVNKRLVAAAAFRNDRQGATNALKRTLATMIDSGIIREVGKAELAKNYNTTQRAFMLSDFAILQGRA